MENKGNMILTLDSGIFEHNGLLDSLLDNGYTITMNKDGLCLYLKYRFKSDEPQVEKVESIPYDPQVEMNIRRMVEERLAQTDRKDE